MGTRDGLLGEANFWQAEIDFSCPRLCMKSGLFRWNVVDSILDIYQVDKFKWETRWALKSGASCRAHCSKQYFIHYSVFDSRCQRLGAT